MQTYPKHDEDFYGWAMATVEALKTGNIMALDVENLIEEIEDLGASKERELTNRLAILLAHLLKWQYQPTRRPWDISGKSWSLTIGEQRSRIKLLIRKNPGLKQLIDESISDAFDVSRKMAARETSLEVKDFPQECPYTLEQLMDDEFYPE